MTGRGERAVATGDCDANDGTTREANRRASRTAAAASPVARLASWRLRFASRDRPLPLRDLVRAERVLGAARLLHRGSRASTPSADEVRSARLLSRTKTRPARPDARARPCRPPRAFHSRARRLLKTTRSAPPAARESGAPRARRRRARRAAPTPRASAGVSTRRHEKRTSQPHRAVWPPSARPAVSGSRASLAEKHVGSQVAARR